MTFISDVVIKYHTEKQLREEMSLQNPSLQSQVCVITVGKSKQELRISLSHCIHSKEQREMNTHILTCLPAWAQAQFQEPPA